MTDQTDDEKRSRYEATLPMKASVVVATVVILGWFVFMLYETTNMTPPILPVLNRRYAAGEIELKAGRRMYVSRGIGHLMRVRFNVRPEVTLFTLTRA